MSSFLTMLFFYQYSISCSSHTIIWWEYCFGVQQPHAVFSLMTGLIPVHMLTNISTSKNNQAMKLGQLIKYNMRNIFLNKSCTKWSGETIPRLFSKKSKLSISLDQ